jgi:hypothetical protein
MQLVTLLRELHVRALLIKHNWHDVLLLVIMYGSLHTVQVVFDVQVLQLARQGWQFPLLMR